VIKCSSSRQNIPSGKSFLHKLAQSISPNGYTNWQPDTESSWGWGIHGLAENCGPALLVSFQEEMIHGHGFWYLLNWYYDCTCLSFGFCFFFVITLSLFYPSFLSASLFLFILCLCTHLILEYRLSCHRIWRNEVHPHSTRTVMGGKNPFMGLLM